MFEEIKAKLGLDISGFEKGLAGARRGIGELTRETGKKLFDLKDVGRTLATALGLNLQSIAEGVARLVTGFSKEQEQALNDLVNSTERAAAAQEAALNAAKRDREKTLEDIAAKEEEYRRSKLTDDERANELGNRLGEILTERAKLEKQGAQGGMVYLRLKNEQLDIEKELREIEAKKQKQEQSAIDEAKRRESELEEERQKAAADQAKAAEEQSKKDRERTEQLKKQTDELKAQASAQAQSMRDARKATVLPSMADVTSGRRNIGSGARRTATMLERERERSTRLADQVQRNAEAVDTAKTPDERKQAQRALDASRAALAQSQSRIRAGEAALGNRVSDANPFAAMEKQLGEINAEIKKLNDTTLAPSSVSTT